MNELLAAGAACAVGILFCALFSGAETGAYRLNRTRHRLALDAGLGRARQVDRLMRDLTSFVTLCLIGTNLASTLVSFSATLACTHLALGAPELVSTVTVGPLLFILGELAPKELFRRYPSRLLYATSPLLTIAGALFAPATRALGLLTTLLRILGLTTEDGSTLEAEERLRQAIAAGAEEGSVTSYQTLLVQNIFSLRGRTVRHAMVPLARVDALEAGQALESARALVRQSGHTRYPVYRNEREAVIGFVDRFDLVFEERPGLTIRNYIQEVIRLAPQERVAEALVRLRRERAHIALVEGPDGRALGIITLKDLVEEITGELKDL